MGVVLKLKVGNWKVASSNSNQVTPGVVPYMSYYYM